MALDDRLEYFDTNNVKFIINILTRHEMIDLNMDIGTLHTSDSLFH